LTGDLSIAAAGDNDDVAFGGFDSLTAVTLATTLGDHFGVQLPALLVFDYPSIEAVSKHIGNILGATAAPSLPAKQLSTHPVANAAGGSEVLTKASLVSLCSRHKVSLSTITLNLSITKN
jgi:acyl carrier protein